MCYYMFLMKYLGFWFRFIMANPERFGSLPHPPRLVNQEYVTRRLSSYHWFSLTWDTGSLESHQRLLRKVPLAV